jgi:hypothetical protein
LILKNQLVILQALATLTGNLPALRQQMRETQARIDSWSEHEPVQSGAGVYGNERR